MGLASFRSRPPDRLTSIVAVILLVDGLALAVVSSYFLLSLSQYNLTASGSFFISWFAVGAAGLGLWGTKGNIFWKLEIGFSTLMSLFGLVLCLIDWIFVGVEHLLYFVPLFLFPIIAGAAYWVLYSQVLGKANQMDSLGVESG
ncbi:MAG: hypothetical protein ACFFAY_00905 [Promethearchaeota archaeon]